MGHEACGATARLCHDNAKPTTDDLQKSEQGCVLTKLHLKNKWRAGQSLMYGID